MIDNRSILTLPMWVKVTLAMTLLFVTLSAIFIAVSFVGKASKSDWILLAMTVANSALTILCVGIVVIFGQTGTSVAMVEKKGEDFLNVLLPKALKRITITDPKASVSRVVIDEETDIFGKKYQLFFANEHYKFWFGLNVHRLFTIYFVPFDINNQQFIQYVNANDEVKMDIDSFAMWLERDVFFFTFGGAQELGYKINYEKTHHEGEHFVSIWATVKADKDLLITPNEKLFWANDIAMMTESYIRTARRAQLNLKTHVFPSPL